MDQTAKILLICTVGGTPEPVVATLKYWHPLRVVFVRTPQSRNSVENILQQTDIKAFIDAGRFEVLEIPDGEDLTSCVERLRPLNSEVERWLSRGHDYRVVVDLTGGTKCMSAAIAMHAHRWKCDLSYVGGSERTKEGVGIVVCGHEEVRPTLNPWDALGYQAVEDFTVLFDQRAFPAAAKVAAQAKTRVDQQARKREFSVLERLAAAYETWDRFDHKNSLAAFRDVKKGANDLCAILGKDRGERLLGNIKSSCFHLEELINTPPPSRYHVIDLLANALRRKEENRFDDAVARLYRAIEAMAQLVLKELHGIKSTAEVPYDRLSENLKAKWPLAATKGEVALGLQDAYALLADLGDPAGKAFAAAGLAGEKSPLVARNHSILAHGFELVSETVFTKLWGAALEIGMVQESDLPVFPTLRNGPNDGV